MPKIVVNGQSVEDAIASVASAGAIPIGGIIPYMAPTVGAPQPPAPSGYEYCDGTAVSTPGSPLFGFAKPSLMKTVAAPGVTQRVIRGGNTNVAYGGATPLVVGGADTHAHTGGTDSQGSHQHNVDPHSHSIANDGSHAHNIAAGGAWGTGGPFTPYALQTDFQGSHSHGGGTGNTAPTTNFNGSHSHNLSINAGSNIPSYVELAYIIRVL